MIHTYIPNVAVASDVTVLVSSCMTASTYINFNSISTTVILRYCVLIEWMHRIIAYESRPDLGILRTANRDSEMKDKARDIHYATCFHARIAA